MNAIKMELTLSANGNKAAPGVTPFFLLFRNDDKNLEFYMKLKIIYNYNNVFSNACEIIN